MASGGQSLPNYDPTFAVQNQSNYTWASSTADVRALQNGSGRIAATWYSATTFSFDINVTDGNPHQIALYVLDWDGKGRKETVQVLDASNPMAVLDTRTIPTDPNPTSTAFLNGTYLVWNISGHVTMRVTSNGAPNAVVSGVFFGGNTPQAPAITSANGAIFTVGITGTFTVTTTGLPAPSLTASGTLPTGVTFTDNGNGSGTFSGAPTTNAGTPYSIGLTAHNGVGSDARQDFTLTVNPPATSGSSASFVTFDTATGGNWVGKYGGEGYSLANAGQSLPSYDPNFGVYNQANFTWAFSTPDARGLQNGSGRIAAAWFHFNPDTTFSFDVNIADGTTRQFALYAVDWDNQGRAETIEIRDRATNQLLDSRSISNFTYGIYLVWNISGHVAVNVTGTSGPNPVISGAFFKVDLANPAPVVTAVNPTAIGLGPFTIEVSGSNFVDGSIVMFGNTPLSTTLVSSSELAAVGTASADQIGTVSVTVQNPGPGGGTSATSQTVLVTSGQAVTPTAAVRFLEQSTFGPTSTLLNQLQQVGLTQFLHDQFNEPMSRYPDQGSTADMMPTQKVLFTNALTRPDQLRQRVALALSEIWVTSGLVVPGMGMAPYMQLLTQDAFTNYRTIMQDVTLSPAMGAYLNMVNNDKPDAAANTHANENYARELLQLFTLGVYALNSDGTMQMDSGGKPIPTYDQNVAQAFARVFTGWTYPTQPGSTLQKHNDPYWIGPMEAVDTNHDTDSKTLLNGTVLSGGQNAAQDLAGALDNIFSHPNVGPFVAKQLIQHLVTSNPSTAYVGRVANAFNSGTYGSFGSGTRGDMQAVIAAILLDPEARRGDDPTTAVSTDGHLREPILYIANLLRAFAATSDGVGPVNYASNLGEPPLEAPSVFNFFPPTFVIPGTTLLGPEFALQTAGKALARIDFVNFLVYGSIDGGTTLDFSAFANLAAADVNQLLDALNALLLHGTLSPSARASVLAAVNAIPSGPTQGLLRAQAAIYLIASSSQYQVQH